MSETTDAAAQPAGYHNPDGIIPARRSWPRILRCWRGLVYAGKYLPQVSEAHMEMSTPANSRAYAQVRAHPNGRKLFRDKPDLLATLSDDTYLATLPCGSLGHAYRSFLNTNRLDAGVYDEATVIRPFATGRNWHDDYYYFIVRCFALHDLLHVLNGYGPDMAGENMAIGFQCGQMEPAGPLKTFGYAMAAAVPGAPVRHKLRVYHQAIERGRRADKLAAAPWEELLDKPLDDVREELGVVPTRIAHPDGIWFTRWTPPGMAPPTRWHYDEILAGHDSTPNDAQAQR
jgi:ubiquinone biosynthesis protein Coq4